MSELTPETAYAIAVSGSGSTFDLPARDETRYLLIVSSLADASRTYSVQLTATPTSKVASLPGSRIEPLDLVLTQRQCHESPAGAAEPASAERCAIGTRTGDREFHLHVTDGDLDDPRQYARIAGELIAEGDEIRVYLDDQLRPGHLHAGLVNEIVRSFDHLVLPESRRLLGNYRDVDGDGKFSVLITPWLDRLQGGRTSLGGMARSSDFRPALETPMSNHADVLYLNANLRPNAHLRTLLAHEFAHVLCFSRRIAEARDRASLPPEEDWLTEAIAHVAEDAHDFGWTNLDYRVSRYLEEPQAAALVVPDYYRAGLWRDPGCRGATYLFLRWCVDHWGEELLRRLVEAPGRGRANLESATGVPFEELYRRWSLAVVLSGRSADPGRSGCQPYRSLDLHGQLGDCQLAGPRVLSLQAGRSPAQLRVNGTATAFLALDSPVEARAVRVQIQADAGAELQISVVCTAQREVNRRPSGRLAGGEQVAASSRSGRK